MNSDFIHSRALNCLLILACFYTLYIAKAVFMPIVVALLLYFLLLPLVQGLKKIYIPEPVGALLVIILFLAAIGYGFYSLSGPAKNLLIKIPSRLPEIAAKIEILKKPLDTSIKGLFNIQKQFEKSTNLENEQTPTVVSVKSNENKPFQKFFISTSDFFDELVIVIFVLYFILATGDLYVNKSVEMSPSFKEKKEVVLIAHEIRTQTTRYLLIKTVTGACLAVAIAIVLYFLKMPSPILWGVLAALLEFIPYLGVLIGTALCALTSLFFFNTILEIILPPLAFYTITSITGSFIVPWFLSKGLELHPVIIFIGVIFGGWMWGIVGAIVAVPLLSILKIFCMNIPSLLPLSKLLGKD